ncbi:MAG: PEP-CTERM system histidine kinase PrsK [Gammaproteobacteria bacterium]|nr:PEP-CTERM system histidine kinase PrsK [Rhodocyclaceae bacterium]MBU3910118.1 PEP-CTERM system histidine kinase PrsK [Gammaproteobacteria bacterium]MBU3989886.1 PEP-CTERM system histidine kinase PrsK [Gammaproteobacteria bacterium]MBU4006125.1 PEP-CTERM system histidine kinase PrsK [Gammaproteobacteria bacterium]MBU4022580.1 PEP-CTERM system histidine kinase PrsK [Gammaproteobacteria bacterium]
MNLDSPTIAAIVLWSYGLATLCYLALAVHQVNQQRSGSGDRAGKAMAAAALATSAWGLGGLLFALTTAGIIRDIQLVFDILRYAAWYAFLLVLLDSAGDRAPGSIRWLAAVSTGIVLGGLALVGLVTASEPAPPQLVRASQFIFLGMTIFALVLLEQLFRNATADSRWNLKPIGIGLSAAFIFDLYFYSNAVLFNRLDEEIFAVRGFAYALVTPLIALSIIRARARTLKVSLSQNVAFHTTTLLAVGLYLLAAAAAGYYVRYLGGSWGGALQLGLLFVALVLLLLVVFSGTTRAKLRVLVGKNFFRYRYDYREEWLKFTKALSAEDAAQPVGQRVIRGLGDMVESPAGALWLRESPGGNLTQSARWNLPVCVAEEDAQGSLVSFLQDSGWVLNLEEYRHLPGRYQGLELPPWLAELPNAWLVVPLGTATEMVGFVVLTTSRTKIDVNWEVNDLLRTAGSQAASYLAQMQATEALLEARKFDSFNRMSAFVVHDLKNIVTQLSLMVKNAERHAENVEFQRDMLLTVRHSVERMKQLMLQLREGVTPADGSYGANLSAVVKRIQATQATHATKLEVKVREPLVTRGQEERIERVIGHLVQNALDATPVDGHVWITVGRDSGMALVEVGDTGHGMSDEFIRDRLFKPFQTTKQAGMGIGAYESYQYIRELGGNIQVESKENMGTRFRVSLPLIEVRQGSDLKQMEMT